MTMLLKEREDIAKGEAIGREKGIKAVIKLSKRNNASNACIIRDLQDLLSLTEAEAVYYLEKYSES